MTDDMKLYSLDELAEHFGVSKRTIYYWRDRQGFPAPIKLAPFTIRWRQADVEKWIESKRNGEDGKKIVDTNTQ